MSVLKKSIFAATAVLVAAAGAQAAVVLGDLAIVRYQATNPDSFSFVALKPLTAGDVINFTDNGWLSAGGFRSGEGVLGYTVPTGGIAAGTVIVATNPSAGTWNASVGTFTTVDSNYAQNASGDQIFAFTGTLTSPSFIYGLTSNRSTWDANATTASTSALPSALSGANVAVGQASAFNADAVYSGPTTGTAAALLASINNAANWTKGTYSSTTNPLPGPASFTVTPPTFASITNTQPSGTSLGTATVNGSAAAGYALANVSITGGASAGFVNIAGSLATNGGATLVYLDLANNSQAAALATTLGGTAGTYNFGTGVTYDLVLSYNPTTHTNPYFFSFDTGGVVINNIGIVPETSSLFGLVVPALALVGRRRRA